MEKPRKPLIHKILSLSLAGVLAASFFAACSEAPERRDPSDPILLVNRKIDSATAVALPKPGDFDGSDCSIAINGGKPFFEDSDLDVDPSVPWIAFSELDSLGRPGPCAALITEGSLVRDGTVYPVKAAPKGYDAAKYPDLIKDGDGSLYRKAQLIDPALFAGAGEILIKDGTDDPGTAVASMASLDVRNAAPVTEYCWSEGLSRLASTVASCASEGTPVLFRVTPAYDGDNLVANGFLLEAKSIGAGDISICAFAYNVQPGVEIDYLTGTSGMKSTEDGEVSMHYVLDTASGTYHLPGCAGLDGLPESAKRTVSGAAGALEADGYEPCAGCLAPAA